jgi:hypothetical protein
LPRPIRGKGKSLASMAFIGSDFQKDALARRREWRW